MQLTALIAAQFAGLSSLTPVDFRVAVIEGALVETQRLTNLSLSNDLSATPQQFGVVQTGSAQPSQCFFLDV